MPEAPEASAGEAACSKGIVLPSGDTGQDLQLAGSHLLALGHISARI